MSNASHKQAVKKPYRPPLLTNLGSYTTLTQANQTGTVSDNPRRATRISAFVRT